MPIILDSAVLKDRSYLDGEETNIGCAPSSCQEHSFLWSYSMLIKSYKVDIIISILYIESN